MEVLEGIHLVNVTFVNVYIVERGEKLILIDTGVEGSSNNVFPYLEKMNRKPEDISLIIITHKHGDHTLGLREILEKTNAKIAAHKDEVEGIIEKTKIDRVDIALVDGDEIEGLKVIHTPGHTPGHICLLDENTGALFVGDIVYTEKGDIDEIPHHYSEDPNLNRESIKKLANVNFKHLLPSHGDPIMGKGKEALLRLIKRFE